VADRTPESTQSHAFAVVRRSSRRLFMFIEQEIARRGGGPVMLYMGEFRAIGRRNVILPGLSELHGVGLVDWQRFPKRHVIALSDRWLAIETLTQAMIVRAIARTQRMPLISSNPFRSMRDLIGKVRNEQDDIRQEDQCS
jgi:hypothetical protein